MTNIKNTLNNSPEKQIEQIEKTVKKNKLKIYNTKIPNGNKLKKKITEEQKKAIKELYNTGDYNCNKLSKIFNTNIQTVKRIVDPEYKEKMKKYQREYYKNYNRSKEKRAEEMKRLNQRKIELYNQGLLKIDDKK